MIPQKDLEELVCVHANQNRVNIEWTRDQEMVRLRRRLLPLLRLGQVLHGGAAKPPDDPQAPLIFAVVKAGSRRYALVDRPRDLER